MYFQYIPRINSISVDILNACACVCECMHAFACVYILFDLYEQKI